MDEEKQTQIIVTFVTRDNNTSGLLRQSLTSLKTDIEFRFIDTDIKSIDDLQYDVLVSPANSYGDLSGGIDKTYYNLLGKKKLQTRVINYIRNYEDGEIHVGSYGIVPIENADSMPRYLLLTPTMVVPTALPKDSRNPYLFMRAVIKAVRKIKNRLFETQDLTILCPIPCVGVGGMNINSVCKQLKIAIESMNKTGIMHEINMTDIKEQDASKYEFMYAGLPIQNMKMANVHLVS